MPASIYPAQKWVDLPMLLPGHLTEGGNTPTERTAITEIRKEIIIILATTTVEDGVLDG